MILSISEIRGESHRSCLSLPTVSSAPYTQVGRYLPTNPHTLTTSPIQRRPRLVQLLLLRYFTMEVTDDVACDQDAGTYDLGESIVAIDVRDKKMMGCSIFSTADGVLKIANDIPMVNENIAEQFLNFAQATTTILMSRRVPETILAFVEKHVERNANGKHFLVHPASDIADHFNSLSVWISGLVLHLMPSSDFSHMFACEELASLYPHGASSFPVASPSNVAGQSGENNIQATQNLDRQEPRCMKLIRCGSLIDLESVASLSCAGAIFTELHRRRSLASSLNSSITESLFNVVSITMFNLLDHVFISEESLLSLQIISHESHPNSQGWSVDSKSSDGKENLSIYGLLHPLASTPQGRAHLRHMFLNPTSNLDIITDRQCTISMLLESNNQEKTRRAVSIVRKMGNIAHTMSHLHKGISSPSSHKSFSIGV
ncbi:hypothetical protein J3F84DRAFT_115460 [Trichoderma pleuroticola]